SNPDGPSNPEGQGGAAGRMTPPLPGPLLSALLRGSPLTAVLYRPDGGEADAAVPGAGAAPGARGRGPAGATLAVETARLLLTRPRGAQVLAGTLAAPVLDPAVLAWRCSLLIALLPAHPDAVLDTYVNARLRHAEEWTKLLDRAVRALRGGIRRAESLALIRFWLPLAVLDRRSPDLLRARPYLTDHRPALDLVARYGVGRS
ncbi:hypothetical protein FraQA3DRAFT_4128, partial [Frankia sp. QA3]